MPTVHTYTQENMLLCVFLTQPTAAAGAQRSFCRALQGVQFEFGTISKNHFHGHNVHEGWLVW